MNLFAGRERLPRNRVLVCDLLRVAQRMPLYPLEKPCNLRALVELRERAPVRISWTILFIKAYAMMSAECRPLRQTYLGWPWPHLYTHPHSVAMLTVNRPDGKHAGLYWGRFIKPEEESLVDLQAQLELYKTAPVEEVFRKQILISRLP